MKILEFGETVQTRIHFEGADATAHKDPRDVSGFKDGEFGMVFANFTLNKLKFAEALPALHEWVRVLKDGGLLYIMVPSQRWIARELCNVSASPVAKVMAYGSQQGDDCYMSLWNARDIRMLFEAVGLATIKLSTAGVELEINGENYTAEQIIAVGKKNPFVLERDKGEVNERPKPRRKQRRSRKGTNT